MIQLRRLPLLLVSALVILPAASAEAKPRRSELATGNAKAKKPKKKKWKRMTYRERLKAERLFNKGRLAYREGDYEQAILKWQESYAISERPLIFESIAAAYERMGEYQKALAALKKWRVAATRNEHAALDAHIERLQERVDKAAAKERRKKEIADERKRRKEAAAKKRRDREERNKRRKQQAKEADKNTLLGWSLVGGGGALVIAGVVMDIIAASNRPDANAECRTQGDTLLCRDSLRDDIEMSDTLAIAGDITWIIGSAVAAGGAAVLVLGTTVEIDADDDGEDDARVLPYATPHGAGVMVIGHF